MASFKVLVGPGRLSYPHLFQPQKQDDGSEKYSTVLLLPPDADLAPLRKALQNAWTDKFGTDQAKWPKKARKPDDVLADAEEKYGPDFAGWTAVSARSSDEPGVVDPARIKVTDKRETYPGRWARMTCAAFGYDNKTKGVTLGLNNVQLLKHDTPIAGKARAEDDFDDYVDDMEDAPF